MRKAKSEQLAAKNNSRQAAASKISKSECKIRDKERPKSPPQFVETRRIGDFVSFAQPLLQEHVVVADKFDEDLLERYSKQSLPNRFQKNEHANDDKLIAITPSTFFDGPASDESDDADDNGGKRYLSANNRMDSFAHGDC